VTRTEIDRLESVVGRLEALLRLAAGSAGVLESSMTPEQEKEAQEAAERHVARRVLELNGLGGHVEPAD
jgi:hypothetical protein